MKIFDKWKQRVINKLKKGLRDVSKQRDRLLVEVYNLKIDIKKNQEAFDVTLREQRKFFEDQIQIACYQEANKWKVLVDERDRRLEANIKESNEVKTLKERLQERDSAFEEMYTSIVARLTTSVNLHQEAGQFLLAADEKYANYKRKYISKN